MDQTLNISHSFIMEMIFPSPDNTFFWAQGPVEKATWTVQPSKGVASSPETNSPGERYELNTYSFDHNFFVYVYMHDFFFNL